MLQPLFQWFFAVYQMDTINTIEPRSWEVRAGYLSLVDIQERSRVLVLRLQTLTRVVSPNPSAPRIYLSIETRDPAEGRSDHASFQQQGYAACVASEEPFAGPRPGAPAPESNPNYHWSQNNFVDLFAAVIARAVGAAAWQSAIVFDLRCDVEQAV